MRNAPFPASAAGGEPTDPDIDLHVPAQRRELRRGRLGVLAVIALGGALGSAGRYGASLIWTVPDGRFPWTTLWVNVTGCAVIGVFMVVISDGRTVHRLLRPFFGTGVLGGFTTFSTYAQETQSLGDAGRPGAGLAYLALTPAVALAAVWAAVWATRRVLAWRTR
ncbi:fluoride efflux transporter FluC [Streptomyces winkii]|uniref:fluoride efflux transporter FluC n=1 Tax=Streptomyces winkii TaxID=3051178 RepID=UPI0028D80E1C|nr:CrcB family protein [Streptomyces sp. DSM 40971]